jgi:hypothetical protein
MQVMKKSLVLTLLGLVLVMLASMTFAFGHSRTLALVLGISSFVAGLCVLHSWFSKLSRWRKSVLGASLGVVGAVVASVVSSASIADTSMFAVLAAAFGWFFEDAARII